MEENACKYAGHTSTAKPDLGMITIHGFVLGNKGLKSSRGSRRYRKPYGTVPGDGRPGGPLPGRGRLFRRLGLLGLRSLEYSLDESTWRTVREAGALHYLAMNVPESEECDVFFRLTLPTMSTSSEEFHTNIQIVAVAPCKPAETFR